MVILGFGSVHAQDAELFCKFIVVGCDHAGVAKGAEVFRREETKASHFADPAHAFVAVFRADGLGRILDDGDVVFLCDSYNWCEVCCLTKEMHGHNGFCLFGDLFFELFGI